VDLAAFDVRRFLVEQQREQTDQPRLSLAAQAQKDEIVRDNKALAICGATVSSYPSTPETAAGGISSWQSGSGEARP